MATIKTQSESVQLLKDRGWREGETMLTIPCDESGMQRVIGYLDPWAQVLNIPCWMPFMWETILSYGSSYNSDRLKEIGRTKWHLEEGQC